MPGRKYSAESSYRYGFNGKENDNEIIEIEGIQQDYGFRIYAPKIGKFLSVDPLANAYSMLTPYQFASNRPIDGVDLDGLEFLKKDITNYTIEYKPVVHSSGIAEGINNATHNAMSFIWNSTIGGLLETGKTINNYFAGGYNEPTPNLVISFDTWQQNLYKYHTETSIGQQAEDFVTAATCLESYEVLPQLFLARKISAPRVPFLTPAMKADELLASKAKVFDRGGSIGILKGKGELNVNSNTKRLTGQMTINNKTIFFEGQVNIENGVLSIKDLGIRPYGGTYNSLDIVNEVGFEPFKQLLDELKQMREKAGYTEGKLEFFRLRPEGSKLADSEKRYISF